MKPTLVITPPREAIERALESWHWLPINGRAPVLVTAFGDIFFEGQDGIWFLDTLEGTIQRVCTTRAELEELLATTEAEDRYCLAVRRASKHLRFNSLVQLLKY